MNPIPAEKQTDRKELYAELQKIAKSSTNILFFIEKSTNQNVVVFELREKFLKTKKPLKLYWLDCKKHNTFTRNRLSLLEKTAAFGYTTKPALLPEWKTINLDRLPTRDIKIGRDSQKQACAITLINGQICILNKVYIKMDGPFKVIHVELYGTTVETRDNLHETITVNADVQQYI